MKVFVDESGNFRPHVPPINNEGERFVTLTAVVFDTDVEYKDFKKDLSALREKYKKYLGTKEIKSRLIRRSNPGNADPTDEDIYSFHLYGDEGVREYKKFCVELKALVKKASFSIISVSTDKVVAQSLYPQIELLPTLLGDLWERIFISHFLKQPRKSRILFDPQLNLTDQVLKSTYQSFIRSGSRYVSQESLKGVNLYKNIFSPNSEDSCGLQLADYCSYPIKRYVESGSYPFFEEVIKDKLHKTARDTNTGKSITMGVKISLNR